MNILRDQVYQNNANPRVHRTRAQTQAEEQAVTPTAPTQEQELYIHEEQESHSHEQQEEHSQETVTHNQNTKMPDNQDLGVIELSEAQKFTGNPGYDVDEFVRAVKSHTTARLGTTEGEDFDKKCLRYAKTRCDGSKNEKLAWILTTTDNGPADRNTWPMFVKKLRVAFGVTSHQPHEAFWNLVNLRLKSYKQEDVAGFLGQVEHFTTRWAETAGTAETWSQSLKGAQYERHVKFVLISLLSGGVKKELRQELIDTLEAAKDLYDIPKTFTTYMSRVEKEATPVSTLPVQTYPTQTQTFAPPSSPRGRGFQRGRGQNRGYTNSSYRGRGSPYSPRGRGGYQNNSTRADFADQGKFLGMDAPRKTADPRTWLIGKNQCFNCLLNGHTVNICTRPPTCPVHPNAGHTWYNCYALEPRKQEIYAAYKRENNQQVFHVGQQDQDPGLYQDPTWEG